MRAVFRSEFERRLVKAARKHCDHIYTLGSPLCVYWQYVYKGETVYGTIGIYDKLVESGDIKEFTDAIVNEYLNID